MLLVEFSGPTSRPCNRSHNLVLVRIGDSGGKMPTTQI